jgi:hypothetical protein
MAKKRNDVAAAKQRKQKMIAIVGAVLLAVLLVIQVPRTMRMLDSGADEAAPPPPAQAEQPASGSAGSPPAEGEISSSAPAATSPADVKLVDSDVAPEPDEGDLASFERFSSKDPFVPQIKLRSDAAAAAAPAPTAGPAPAPSSTEAATGGLSGSAAPIPSTATPPAPQDGWSSDGEPAERTSAEISINGKAELVTVGKAFPKAEPTFRLVAVKRDSVKVGIAGDGKFTSGAKAMTLTKGKPLTLVNTRTGTRYVVILLSVA